VSGPILNFREVTFGYHQEREVLKNLSFQIESGSANAVLGPNGVGKTTILHLALGWLKAWEGQIEIDGISVQSFRQRERGRLMSLVPQREHIPFEYSLLDYVLLGRAPHLGSLEIPGDADYEIGLNALEHVGLGGVFHRSITRLSSGERQLLLLARSLVQQPRLLLLDEPTSHLDMANKRRIVELLKGMRSRGITLLFTTHDPQVASALADHLLLMKKGEVMASGTPLELLTTELLTATYGVEVKVLEVGGKRIAFWE
jgi:iron complex transport system ATP-binding protein